MEWAINDCEIRVCRWLAFASELLSALGSGGWGGHAQKIITQGGWNWSGCFLFSFSFLIYYLMILLHTLCPQLYITIFYYLHTFFCIFFFFQLYYCILSVSLFSIALKLISIDDFYAFKIWIQNGIITWRVSSVQLNINFALRNGYSIVENSTK